MFAAQSVEYIDRYCPGGYHPIEVNEKLNQRYHIVDKLGQGGYSTTWLARDQELNKCSVAESIKASRYNAFQLDVARALAAQLILATAYVHQAGFVHGDIHLRNVLLQLPGSEIDQLSIQQIYEKYYKPEPYPVARTDSQPVTSTFVPKNVYRSNWLGKPSGDLLLPEASYVLLRHMESGAYGLGGHG
ncbi:CMGC SRPK kinase [Fusarium coicis]|nr:CMGC SRPK kinase [Fusarium coicis]